MIKKIAFVSFRSKDMDADKRFFGELLGLKPSMDMGKWAEFVAPDQKTIAVEEHSPEGTPCTLALETDDIEAEVSRLKEAGVAFHGEIQDNKVCKMAFTQTPSGHPIMLHQIAADRLTGDAKVDCAEG
jgi:predicted enzyme related to lactoylglutathione lyase